jgi:copper(I)-binding protein
VPSDDRQQRQRRHILQRGLALGLAPVLALPRQVSACEYFAPTLRITHPWTRATGPDANQAIVCMKFDEILQDDRLIAVATPVAARAAIGGKVARPDVDLPIRSGQELMLEEDGIHIVLQELQQPLYIARSYPLTLVFERGGRVDASLSVDFLPRPA